MATVFTFAQTQATFGPPRAYKAGPFRLDVVRCNFDQLAIDTGQALAHTDSYPLYQVRQNQQIICSGAKVLKVATGAATASLGFTGGTVDYFMDDMAVNSLTGHTAAMTNVRGPYCNTNAGDETIDLLEDGAAASLAGCILDVWFFIALF